MSDTPLRRIRPGARALLPACAFVMVLVLAGALLLVTALAPPAVLAADAGEEAVKDAYPGTGAGGKVSYPHGEYRADCALCHKADKWAPAVVSPAFKHEASGFPLEGAHKSTPCRACHASLDFKKTARACADCHKDVHQGELGADCSRCHTPRNFIDRSAQLSQHRATRFPLTGYHVTLDCESCHKPEQQGKLVYVNTPVECIACHQTQFNSTTSPNHVSSGFSTDCTRCHSTAAWIPATFDHAAGGFPLTGAHKTLQCSQCHPNNQYTGIPTDCNHCHSQNYDATTNPNHATAGFSRNCAACHTTKSFTPAQYNHSATGFPLTGAHKTVQCTQCHPNNQFPGTPTDCYSCHQAQYNGTTSPNHATAGFGTDCKVCHTTTTWAGAKFDHAKTAFPLTGAHKAPPLACSACHATSQTPPTDCYACHQAQYNGATDPNHLTLGFPTDCKACHSTTTWSGAKFDHSKTAFPLTGAHKSPPLACSACHAATQTPPTDCYACHQAQYNGTTDPNHVTLGFPTDCKSCHSTTSWSGATFNHASTGFALTGAHASPPLACSACHTSSAVPPTDCYACHQAQYNGTTDPNHVTLGFPTDCKSCHSTTSWSGATFNHASTGFALTGAHASPPLACSACHTTSAPPPTTCVGCHQAQYNSTTNPPHAAAGFSTDCSQCHNTTTFTNARYTQHDSLYFPIYSGSHNGRWSACADCHTNSSNYAVFTCLTCHDQSRTNSAHQGVSGYSYDSQLCYHCHPRGSGGD